MANETTVAQPFTDRILKSWFDCHKPKLTIIKTTGGLYERWLTDSFSIPRQCQSMSSDGIHWTQDRHPSGKFNDETLTFVWREALKELGRVYRGIKS